ncbi:hypothetical protein C5167_004901 [Papaver somniferum]|uniref:Alpha/beta hydrolase fold-3 domain-containing protein n=1 Tax=Papaver somniferum TaxID=3469 RepID=A0A4Y7J8X4_PAPSO|nr:probable carboxylesterase 9 [Papaver somniferum]RZC57594.1 hypothetical protein C5167_004901 [Papaver somniferum]
MSEEPKRKPPNNEKSVKASSPDAEELEEKASPPIDPWAMLKIVRNPDGSITRQTDLLTVPPTTEEEMSVPGLSAVTKDVTLNAENGTWVRIYRPTKIPSNDTNVARLPVIVYFHCGAFIMFSADNVFDNEPCTRFCSETLSIVVSVNFRLVPENKLPAAYEDGVEALLWLKNQAVDPDGEQWLKDYADFSRCYIMGASTGGTVAYYTALRATAVNLEPVKLHGLILNQPFFTGTKKTKSERKSANDAVIPAPVIDVMVELALPDGSDHDHEYLNPMTKSEYSDNIKKLPRTLVRGFEGDPTLDRQMELVRVLIRHGVPVTAHFSEIGFHLIDFIDPKRHLAMLKYLKDFII